MSNEADGQQNSHRWVRDTCVLAVVRPGTHSVATKHSPARKVLDVLGEEPLATGITMRPSDGPEVDLIAAPTGRWPIPAGSFGWVDAGPELACCPAAEVAHILQEAYRILRPGGRFTATVPLAGEAGVDDSSPRMPWYRETPGFFIEGSMLGSPAKQFVLVDRTTTLSLASDRSVARPLSTILGTLLQICPPLRSLGARHGVTRTLLFTLQKPYRG